MCTTLDAVQPTTGGSGPTADAKRALNLYDDIHSAHEECGCGRVCQGAGWGGGGEGGGGGGTLMTTRYRSLHIVRVEYIRSVESMYVVVAMLLSYNVNKAMTDHHPSPSLEGQRPR